MVDGIDAVLCDRLKELGLDFVASVIEGSRKPTQEQIEVLQRGYPSRRRNEQGVPLIGGCADGRRADTQLNRVQIPTVPDRVYYSEHPQQLPITYDTYRRERLAANQNTFSFFVVDSMPIENAIEQLIDGYRYSAF